MLMVTVLWNKISLLEEIKEYLQELNFYTSD